jgi:hypothetical protein
MNIHLVIQRTFSGLTTEYGNDDNSIKQLDSNLFFTDERSTVSQLTDAPIFSLARNEQWICYSVIRKTLDRERRSGFYAVRLLVPASHYLTNIKKCLEAVANKYAQDIENKTPVLDYSSLLRQIDEKAIKEKENLYAVVNDSAKRTKYYHIDTAVSSESIESLFNNDKRSELIEKLYIFTKEVRNEYLEQFQLKPIAQIRFQEWQIDDPHHYIRGLWVAQNSIARNSKAVLTIEGKQLSFQLPNQEKRILMGNTLTVRKVTINDPEEVISSVRVNNYAIKGKGIFYLYGLASDTFYYTLKNGEERQVPNDQNELTTRKLTVKNPDGALAHFWIDGKERPIPSKKEFKVYGLVSEQWQYSCTYEKDKKEIDKAEKELVVKLPPKEKPKPAPNTGEDKEFSWEEVIIFSLLFLLLGGIAGYFYNNYRYNAKTEILDNEKKEINDKVNKSNGKITFLKSISGTKSITTDTQSATTNSTK